jgi:TPR repeat protein
LNRKQISLIVIGLSIGIILFAAYQFGTIYTHSKGLEADAKGDYSSARSLWKISANLGYTPSKATLGVLYLTGKGGRADPELADKYLRAASEDGYMDAQTVYGMALYAGATLPINREWGLRWLREAAAQGDFGARNFLNLVGEQ